MIRLRILSTFLFIFFGLFFTHCSHTYAQTSADWYMAGANPQRTSWISNEVSGNKVVEWYRPIEAYIPQHFQLITVNNIVYAATGKGLYALRADNGDIVWRFDTDMPMGNSPTVFEGKVYIGNFDKKLYVLDASTGQLLWTFNSAQAGFSVNPLVIRDSFTNNQPVVLVGNRDGNFYAIGAHGHQRQGQILWKYTIPENSPILMSAAYKEGVVYTTAMDNRLYALKVNPSTSAGELKSGWNTPQFPGDAFMAYWPVIYKDKIILVKSSDIKDGWRPGSLSMTSPISQQTTPMPTPTRFNSFGEAERNDLNSINPTDSTAIGEILPPVSWSGGYQITDARYALDYLEEPTVEEKNSDPAGKYRFNHKPWRREYFVVNQSDGREFTFDSDSDGLNEYVPVLYWRAESGPMYPPVIGQNNIAYFTAPYIRGQIMGWNIDQPNYLSFTDNNSYALDEPLSVSMAGNRVYTSLCCDRPALSFSINAGQQAVQYWHYTLSGSGKAPGYDEMWQLFEGNIDRHQGTYVGIKDWYGTTSDGVKTTNASFNSHGVQNPLIPHQGRIFIHRSNAIVALGDGPQQGKKSYLPIQQASLDNVSIPDLSSKLEAEINRVVSVDHLKPGYHVQNQFSLSMYGKLTDYFAFPSDTLLTLSQAYPYLSSETQTKLSAYLREEWQQYFYPTAYANRGWMDGIERHHYLYPPEITSDYSNMPKSLSVNGHIWMYPQQSIYAIWKYAQNIPAQHRPSIQELYQVAKSKVQVPATSNSLDMERRPYEINAWIAGYKGFLELFALAGSPAGDLNLKNNVQNEYNRLLAWRVSSFSKESWAYPTYSAQHKLDTSRNFIWLTPELADYLMQNIPDKIQTALDEYTYLNQYWFVNRFENDMGESSTQHLFNYHALFSAKALLLKENRQELSKFLDVPSFERGDLFYIQNVVYALQASSDPLYTPPPVSPTLSSIPSPVCGPSGDIDCNGTVNLIDLSRLLSRFGQSGSMSEDIDKNGTVNLVDLSILLSNFGRS